MISITPPIQIDENEIHFDFIRAASPGGQNVNKVSTACQLRFDVAGNSTLGMDVKRRLKTLAGKRMTDDGQLVIEARRYRSQEMNKADAIERLITLIQKAAQPIPPRTRTKPTKASIERRLTEKKQRSQIKHNRFSNLESES